VTNEPVVTIEAVNHHYGEGALRRQVLQDVSLAVQPGEIVILTGPSGSGKTTLLTLIGALRSTQDGSLRVLGREMRSASEATLVGVRRQIGYVFQMHNLLDALTAEENVMMGLRQAERPAGSTARERAREMLASVGLKDHARQHPPQLSGGQKQRVAIARALVGRPRIILADEPTASLDRSSGREVVDRIHDLAKREETAVLLVTHDARILDVADRIVHLEEGRLSSFADAVLASTQQLLGTIAKSGRHGELPRQVAAMSVPQFREFLDGITAEAQRMLQVMTLSTDDAFELLLTHVLEACTLRIGGLLEAERCSLLLADEARGVLWSKVVQEEGGRPVEFHIPITSGIAGHVYRTGESVNIPDAYEHPLFNREVDQQTGYRTRGILCVPLVDRTRHPFAVMSVLNRRDGQPFDRGDEKALSELAPSVGVILETWHQATQVRRGQRDVRA
jgi:putative ABC transport system ATP-binding protein